MARKSTPVAGKINNRGRSIRKKKTLFRANASRSTKAIARAMHEDAGFYQGFSLQAGDSTHIRVSYRNLTWNIELPPREEGLAEDDYTDADYIIGEVTIIKNNLSK